MRLDLRITGIAKNSKYPSTLEAGEILENKDSPQSGTHATVVPAERQSTLSPAAN